MITPKKMVEIINKEACDDWVIDAMEGLYKYDPMTNEEPEMFTVRQVLLIGGNVRVQVTNDKIVRYITKQDVVGSDAKYFATKEAAMLKQLEERHKHQKQLERAARGVGRKMDNRLEEYGY